MCKAKVKRHAGPCFPCRNKTGARILSKRDEETLVARCHKQAGMMPVGAGRGNRPHAWPAGRKGN